SMYFATKITKCGIIERSENELEKAMGRHGTSNRNSAVFVLTDSQVAHGMNIFLKCLPVEVKSNRRGDHAALESFSVDDVTFIYFRIVLIRAKVGRRKKGESMLYHFARKNKV